MAIEKEYGTFIPYCDGCGDRLYHADVFEDARTIVQEANWVTKRIDDAWVIFCPTCQEDME